jgi:hypothetical protein
MNKPVRIDPKEFGLEEKSVKTIEAAFAPKIAEREGFVKVYETLITGELTPELCVDAKALRNKLVKVRTGIAEVHKTQKAFFLASGKFVDAWKNKETLPVSQMEEKLSDIEKHFENIEAQRVFKLAEERTVKLSAYEPEMIIPNIGEMDESVWTNFLGGIISGYNQRKLDELNDEKARLKVIEEEKEAARLKAIEDEKIRKDNIRLKAEADERERLATVEREKREKAEAERIKKEVEAEKKRNEKAQKEKAAFDLKLKQEREKREKIEREEKERKDKEAAELKAKQLADKKASQAPDKDKLVKSINEMVFIDAEFKTAEAEAVYNVINQKFEGFKTWAIAQTKSL